VVGAVLTAEQQHLRRQLDLIDQNMAMFETMRANNRSVPGIDPDVGLRQHRERRAHVVRQLEAVGRRHPAARREPVRQSVAKTLVPVAEVTASAPAVPAVVGADQHDAGDDAGDDGADDDDEQMRALAGREGVA
jgi:hypothetical protein